MTFIEWAQERLVHYGFNPGKIDGVWGRETRAAVQAFQKANELPQSGTLNVATVEKLQDLSAHDAPIGASTAAPTAELHEEFPWMQIILRKKGLQEGRDNKALREFLKSDGKTLGDPSKLPWCGDLIETAIALALPHEILPTNPYLARNWLKFGTPVSACYGAVMVFGRPGAPQNGHVSTYYAEDKTHYHILGGNQSNSISVTRIAKGRLLGARMPLTGGPYKRIQVHVAANGAVSRNEA